MKTNCPHCNGEIIIPVRCCRGDEAITGVYAPDQYEKMQLEEKTRAEEKEVKRMRFYRELDAFKKNNSTTFEKFSLHFFTLPAIAFLFDIPLAFLFAWLSWVAFHTNGFISEHRNLILSALIIMLMGSIELNMIQEKTEESLKKRFIDLHPEYEEYK